MIVSKRHKRLALKTRVVKNITQIPAGDWNKVYPDVLESYNFYKTLDESVMNQFSLFHIQERLHFSAVVLHYGERDGSGSGIIRRGSEESS